MSEIDLEKLKEEYYNKGFVVGATTIISIILVSMILLQIFIFFI